jgi:glutamyl-tRNA reductase
MSLLVVGASYRTAEVALLERLAVAASRPELLAGLLRREHVTEAVVLATCNRVEVYAGVTAFHGGVADVSAALAELAGTDPAALAQHLYVHWDADAVTHALRVAAGLDSMVAGESQILGQVREAYAAAARASATGRLLHDLMQQALRVGKRVRSETGIDAAGRNVVTTALRHTGDLAGRHALVLGAGSMGALALATLARAGASPLYLANRDGHRARRLAASYGAEPVGLADVGQLMSTVDLVVSATTSIGPVLTADTIKDALAARTPDRGPLIICDLAVPRDVEPAAATLPGVVLIDLERLAAAAPEATGAEVVAAERIVAAEAGQVGAALRDLEVAPTVAALRSRADELVSTELERLLQRLPEMTEAERAEVARTVHRIVQRLLHQPTVRVRQLAAEPGGENYAAVLAELFDLQVPRASRVAEVPGLGSAAA